MVVYRCFNCNKEVKEQYLRKNVRCPYCGYKIIFKERNTIKLVSAR